MAAIVHKELSVAIDVCSWRQRCSGCSLRDGGNEGDYLAGEGRNQQQQQIAITLTPSRLIFVVHIPSGDLLMGA